MTAGIARPKAHQARDACTLKRGVYRIVSTGADVRGWQLEDRKPPDASWLGPARGGRNRRESNHENRDAVTHSFPVE